MKRRWPGVMLLALGLLWIGIGLIRSEQMVVVRKAITICLECIGIG